MFESKKHIGNLLTIIAVAAGSLLLSQCSETEAPAPPDNISIVSGDNQYSRRGTELPEPLVVSVRTEDGSIPEEGTVIFTVIQGGGSVSRGSAAVNAAGDAATRLTLGPATGTHMVRAYISGLDTKSVVFEATSSNFFCPEAEDTLRVSYNNSGHLFLATSKSAIYPENSAGIVRVKPTISTAAFGFLEIPPFSGVRSITFDVAFSPRGDFYLARRVFFPEIVKIDPSGAITPFVDLEVIAVDNFVEIATNPIGLLAGCDNLGPFVVDCNNSLIRFAEATYTDGINNDAMAVDPRRHSENPLGEDIYFIYKTDATLYRLPLDSLSVEAQGRQNITTLTADQAASAVGMACDKDGNVYILVDSQNTKALLKVTPGGTQSLLVDFFVERGQGDAAGMQSDLAYDDPFLYTIDTLNDQLLRYDVVGGSLSEILTDQGLSSQDSGGNPTGGERVGLAVLP